MEGNKPNIIVDMPELIIRYFFKLIESYLFIALAAILLGLVYPMYFGFFSPYTTLMLQVIFFMSSLKLDTAELLHVGKEWKSLFSINLVILFILPIIVYLIASVTVPSMVFALVLLACMPAGMSLPLMVDVIGGNKSLALLITITSSLLSPITVPLVLQMLTHTSVDLPFLPMVWKLFMVIVIPFALAQIVRRFSFINVGSLSKHFKPISLLLLGLLIAGSIAVNARAIAGETHELFSSLLILFVFFIAIHVFTHLLFHKKIYQDQVTIAASVTFMNFTLAIYLASLYAPDPKILFILVLSIIPWAILLVPFKFVTDKMKGKGWVS